MLVIDTSVFVDYLFEEDNNRNKTANEFLSSIEGLTVFIPKIFLIELISVAKRLNKTPFLQQSSCRAFHL